MLPINSHRHLRSTITINSRKGLSGTEKLWYGPTAITPSTEAFDMRLVDSRRLMEGAGGYTDTPGLRTVSSHGNGIQ